jgi:hypothetical protein
MSPEKRDTTCWSWRLRERLLTTGKGLPASTAPRLVSSPSLSPFRIRTDDKASQTGPVRQRVHKYQAVRRVVFRLPRETHLGLRETVRPGQRYRPGRSQAPHRRGRTL